MRVLMIQPNYHSGGAEIAGNWPPSWVPYVGGALKTAGFTDIRFVDAMTNYIADADLAEIVRTHQPDLVLATAITPMIYQSQETLKIVKQVCPQAKTIMGGVHPTYMYEEVFGEAPWVDYIIRGEGEEITVNLVRAIANGTDERDRHDILGIAFLENGIDRNLGVHWGINTRVTDILRDENELALYHQAGLVHVSLGTEAAAQLNLNVFRKETTIADNKRAVELLRRNGIVAEVQFIMGLPNETTETIQETYRMARDWKADMTNWNMYTPWPFAELFQELEDRVEIRDYSHYNFVTPIIKPDNLTREELLKRVLRNYARFYLNKTWEYWFERDPFKRRYLLGCLWAFLKTTLNKRFYNLKRVKRHGLHTEVEFGFDASRILSPEEMAQRKQSRRADVNFTGTVSACGAPNDLPSIDDTSVPEPSSEPIQTIPLMKV